MYLPPGAVSTTRRLFFVPRGKGPEKGGEGLREGASECAVAGGEIQQPGLQLQWIEDPSGQCFGFARFAGCGTYFAGEPGFGKDDHGADDGGEFDLEDGNGADLDVGAVYGYQYVQGAGEAEAGGF